MGLLDALKWLGQSYMAPYRAQAAQDERAQQERLLNTMRIMQAMDLAKKQEARAEAGEARDVEQSKRAALEHVLRVAPESARAFSSAEGEAVGPRQFEGQSILNPSAFQDVETLRRPEIAGLYYKNLESERISGEAAKEAVAQRAEAASKRAEEQLGISRKREERMVAQGEGEAAERAQEKALRSKGNDAIKMVVTKLTNQITRQPDPDAFAIGMRAKELIEEHGFKSTTNAIGKAYEEIKGRPRSEILGKLPSSRTGVPGPDMQAVPTPSSGGATTLAGAAANKELEAQLRSKILEAKDKFGADIAKWPLEARAALQQLQSLRR